MRKDIERAFGVLLPRLNILERQLRGLYLDNLQSLINYCIIMHSMYLKRDAKKIALIIYVKILMKKLPVEITVMMEMSLGQFILIMW